MEQKEFKRIKANWHKMEEKDIRGILEEILYEVLAEPEELMLKYAKDEEQMKAILHEKEEDDEGISRLRISKEEDRELTYVEVNDLLCFGMREQNCSKHILEYLCHSFPNKIIVRISYPCYSPDLRGIF